MSNTITPTRTEYAVYGLSAATGICGTVYWSLLANTLDWSKVLSNLSLAGVGLFGLSRLQKAEVTLPAANPTTELTHQVVLERLSGSIQLISKMVNVTDTLSSSNNLTLDILMDELTKISHKIFELKQSEAEHLRTIEQCRLSMEDLSKQLEELKKTPVKEESLAEKLQKIQELVKNGTPTKTPVRKQPTSTDSSGGNPAKVLF